MSARPWNLPKFVGMVSAGGVSGWLARSPTEAAAERPPETRPLRLALSPAICHAPWFVAQAMRELPYGRWREYDPEDTARFHSLRLREAGLIRSTPQRIIVQGTDWPFLDELKKELKG